MTLPLLTLPENGQVHIYISALPSNAPPAGEAATAAPPRRRPLLLTTCALLLVAGGYALHASTSAPAAADILAGRADNLRFTMPQPPLPGEMPPALRLIPPRPYDNPSLASGPLPVPGSAAPAPPSAAALPLSTTLGSPQAAAPPANPFGLR